MLREKDLSTENIDLAMKILGKFQEIANPEKKATTAVQFDMIFKNILGAVFLVLEEEQGIINTKYEQIRVLFVMVWVAIRENSVEFEASEDKMEARAEIMKEAAQLMPCFTE